MYGDSLHFLLPFCYSFVTYVVELHTTDFPIPTPSIASNHSPKIISIPNLPPSKPQFPHHLQTRKHHNQNPTTKSNHRSLSINSAIPFQTNHLSQSLLSFQSSNNYQLQTHSLHSPVLPKSTHLNQPLSTQNNLNLP